jgi:hypothetical protein
MYAAAVVRAAGCVAGLGDDPSAVAPATDRDQDPDELTQAA